MKKEKILTFIIGLLVGAIITAGGFLIYSKMNKTEVNNNQMGGEPPEMMQEGNNFRGRPGNLDAEDTDNTTEESKDGNTTSTKSKGNRQKNGSNIQGDNQGTPPEKPLGDDSSRPELPTDQKQNTKTTTESNT